VWDYINRAMPLFQEGTLTADQIYAVTAFLFYRNGIIKEEDVMDPRSLPEIQIPNRNGWVPARLDDIPDLRKWKPRPTIPGSGSADRKVKVTPSSTHSL
jgi:hypothetical protein